MGESVQLLISFLLDEMYTPAIAEAARARGLQVRSSHEVGRDGTKDDEQLRAVTRAGQCIITENHRHFAPMAERFLERGEAFSAIILAPRSLRDGPIPRFVDAIEEVARLYPGGLPPNSVIWLRSPR